MSIYLYSYGYDMIIHEDRLEEAREWIDEQMGFDIADFDQNAARGGMLHLNLEDAYGEGPFWGNVSPWVLDDLKRFADEFAYEGSYFKLFDDDNHAIIHLKVARNGVQVLHADIDDLFSYVEQYAEQKVAAPEYLAGDSMLSAFEKAHERLPQTVHPDSMKKPLVI